MQERRQPPKSCGSSFNLHGVSNNTAVPISTWRLKYADGCLVRLPFAGALGRPTRIVKLIRYAKSTDAAHGCPALLNGEDPQLVAPLPEYWAHHRVLSQGSAVAGVCESIAVTSTTSAAITLVTKRIGGPPIVIGITPCTLVSVHLATCDAPRRRNHLQRSHRQARCAARLLRQVRAMVVTAWAVSLRGAAVMPSSLIGSMRSPPTAQRSVLAI